MGYFHHRSGKNIDFFFPGWRVGHESKWEFDPRAFNRLREDIECRSDWQYSGSVDLILTNAKLTVNPHFIPSRRNARLDFGTAIVCDLDKMKKDGAILSVETFFEEIFRFAEDASGDDPTWGFSDKKGLDSAGSVLKRVLLSLIPKTLSEEARRAAHFAVKDISARV